MFVPEPVDPNVPAFLESNDIPVFKATLFLYALEVAPAKRKVAATYLLADIFVIAE